MPQLLDDDSAKRVFAAVRKVEGQSPDQPRRVAGGFAPVIQFVLVTSTTTTDSLYPCKVQLYNSATTNWEDFGVSWLRGPTGSETFAINDRVAARLCGSKAADGKPIFISAAAVTGVADPCCETDKVKGGGLSKGGGLTKGGAKCGCKPSCGCGGGSGEGSCHFCSNGTGTWTDSAGNVWRYDGSMQGPVWCGPGIEPINGPAPGPNPWGGITLSWVRIPTAFPGCFMWVAQSGGGIPAPAPAPGGGVLPGPKPIGGGGPVPIGGGFGGPPIVAPGGGNGWPTCPPGYYLGVDWNCHQWGAPPIWPAPGGTLPPGLLPPNWPRTMVKGGNLSRGYGLPKGGGSPGAFVYPNQGGTGLDGSTGASGDVIESNGSGGFQLTAIGSLVQANIGTTITYPALSGNVNDLDPGGTVSLLRLTTDGSGVKTVTGLKAGYDGQQIIIENFGVDNINLALGSASSTAANRFNNGGAAGNDTIAGQSVVAYVYSGSAGISRWRKFA